jgi:hypothetical protein
MSDTGKGHNPPHLSIQQQQESAQLPFSLESYPQLTIRDSYPQFSALTDDASGNLMEVLAPAKMQALEKELEQLAKQTDTRKQRLKQELSSIEAHIALRFPAGSGSISPTQRIKLNLKGKMIAALIKNFIRIISNNIVGGTSAVPSGNGDLKRTE